MIKKDPNFLGKFCSGLGKHKIKFPYLEIQEEFNVSLKTIQNWISGATSPNSKKQKEILTLLEKEPKSPSCEELIFRIKDLNENDVSEFIFLAGQIFEILNKKIEKLEEKLNGNF